MKEEAMTGYKKFCRGNGKSAPRTKIIKRFLQRRRQRKLAFLFARLRALLPHPLKVTGQHAQKHSSGLSSSLVQANQVNPRETASTCSHREKGSLPDVRVNRIVGSNLLMIQIMTYKELGLLSSLFSVLENEDLEVLSAQTISMTESKIFRVILVKFLPTTELNIGNVHSKLYSVASGRAEIVSNREQQDINKTG